jgi:hypothetical protein
MRTYRNELRNYLKEKYMTIPKHPTVIWFAHSDNDSMGLLFIDGEFQHFIIGDEPRAIKVMHETRLRAGIYPLAIRKEGGFHNRYSSKFPNIHKGMVWIKNVPEFEYILYHIMNDEGDSSACIGGGDVLENKQNDIDFTGKSSQAYIRTYPKFIKYITENESPILEVIDLDQS